MKNTAISESVPGKKLASKRELKKHLLFFAFITPALIGFLGFTIYPLFKSLYLSFTDATLIQDPDFPAKIIGWENYKKIFTIDINLYFGPALLYTFIYAIIAVPMGMIISLGMALILNKDMKGSGFFKVVFYLPSILPAVAMSIMFRWLFTPGADGFINSILRSAGVQNPPLWLGAGSGNLGLGVIIFMSFWGFGGRMLIFLGALKGVPKTLYEAADLDGASAVTKFFKITLPMISPIFFYNLVTTTIGALQVFNESLIVGGGTKQTTFITYYIYKTAYLGANPSLSYASAMAWVLFVIIAVLTGGYFIASKGKVYREE